MLTMLIAYAANGDIVATLDHLVSRDSDGNVTGLIDFAAHEEAGGELLEVWNVDGAAGSKVWPEWLGHRAHEFSVELEGEPGKKRVAALVHKVSGLRRERADIEARIQQRKSTAKGEAVDLRDLVGGPGKPLTLDDEGKTVKRPNGGTPSHLPVIRGPESMRSARR